MGFVEILLILGGALVFAPITAYIASSHGRSFWRWFALGMALPFFSVFVALFVAMRSQWAEERAAGSRPKSPPTA
ncbi:MAG TPA: hypothetical protein VF629_19435 [Hymenobacter sp.]|uniref:hypothetical protein n=1 Tax=Hymenobacter sp. TaxID=1898978 RepID=UPI002EDB760A